MNRGAFCTLCLICSAAAAACFAAEPIQPEASLYNDLRIRAAAVEIGMSDLRADIANYYTEQGSSAVPLAEHELLLEQLGQLEVELIRLNEQLGSGNIASVTEDGLVSRGASAYGGSSPPASPEPPLLSLQNNIGDDTGLEISGFMDAVYELNAVSNKPNMAYLNQVEIDFVRTLNSRAEASLGVVYSEGFQIGAAVISYQIKPESESSTSVLKRWSASAGQFDAPFGEDVGFYPSNQRKSISVPDAVTGTHNCWNHVGVTTNLALPITSVDFWTVQGFDLQTNAELEEPLAELNFSTGSRVNFDLLPGLRFGGSAASGWLPDGAPAMQLYGAHAVFEHSDWSLIAEGIQLEEQVSEQSLLRRGYYVQTVRQLNQFFALARADYIEGSDIDTHRHYSLGGGLNLGSGLELRSEYQFNHKANRNQGLLQIVATF